MPSGSTPDRWTMTNETNINDPDYPYRDGITVDTVAGPMLIPWGQVGEYYRLVSGPSEGVPPKRHRWWQR